MKKDPLTYIRKLAYGKPTTKEEFERYVQHISRLRLL